ncbi:MAG: BCD family MFS transporter [Ramlibacter sp.]|uniref:BCD family MFS transporter n=1 Tax=Ramlibacter sp. TaxID=1917967 RepID=UPI002602B001|nr:BCD family MFS transporter [Ramlibacter sp.]MDH4374952.1 BCD family MFS transporter [Ramlibacter sp.]
MKMAFRLPPALIGVFSRYVPFADAASPDLPLARLLRLSLFQVAVGITTALLVGTLNRVMIVELGVPAWWVALSVALPLVFAPLRALIGYRSDTHPSVLGLRRLPYLWMGTLLMFGGLAIMPFALMLLSEADTTGALWFGRTGAALAFIVVGAGLQITQTAGIALANDVSSDDKRPRVVALLYAMLLVGLIIGSAMLGGLLEKFSPLRLIQVVQGAAVVVVVLNLMSLWKQEARGTRRGAREPDGFSRNWKRLMALPKMRRFLWTVGLGTAAFSMQDIVLEPFGGEVLGLDVGLTSALTALSAGGALCAFLLAARLLGRGVDAVRLAAAGALLGLPAFACVIFSAPLESPNLFRLGAGLIGFSGGLFSVGMLLTAMDMPERELTGMVLGAWGAVQATAAGVAMALGGVVRDIASHLAMQGWLGESLISKATGYSVVFHLEIYLLFVVLVALGPLARRRSSTPVQHAPQPFGLAQLPG